jgi:signal transduction histidine kinase
MNGAPKLHEQLAALAKHLGQRRATILRTWRQAVEHDPQLSIGASLPRSQLNDHIPALLDTFERRLRSVSETHNGAVKPEADAASHGLQRWQQGYDLREVTREWGLLQLCVMDELEAYGATHPELEPRAMPTARREWAHLCSDGVSESATKYFQLQQVEAVGHVRDLEQALEQVRELERQRAQLWHEAAHDLRGNLGVVANAAAGLSLRDAPEPLRDNFLRILNKNVTSLHALLEDVTNLARLQAGRERRQVAPFDAALALTELCERLQPLAHEQNLFLESEGPTQLLVEGDAVKTQRIAQNLLFNALKYTLSGGVTMSWGDSRPNDANRWMLQVHDTGPGFHAGPGAPMTRALEEATEEGRHVEDAARNDGATGASAPPHAAADSRPVHQERGEGIGLSIVKRLCELLDASMEMESKIDEGTTVRIVFPRRYGAQQTQ